MEDDSSVVGTSSVNIVVPLFEDVPAGYNSSARLRISLMEGLLPPEVILQPIHGMLRPIEGHIVALTRSASVLKLGQKIVGLVNKRPLVESQLIVTELVWIARYKGDIVRPRVRCVTELIKPVEPPGIVWWIEAFASKSPDFSIQLMDLLST